MHTLNYEENQSANQYYPFDFDRTQRWFDGQGGWKQVHVVQPVQTFWTKGVLRSIQVRGWRSCS